MNLIHRQKTVTTKKIPESSVLHLTQQQQLQQQQQKEQSLTSKTTTATTGSSNHIKSLRVDNEEQGSSSISIATSSSYSPTTTTTTTTTTTIMNKNNTTTTTNNNNNNTAATTTNNNDDKYNNSKQRAKPLFRRTYSSDRPKTPQWVYIVLLFIIIITIVSMPVPLHLEINQVPTLRHVFYYGWLTCVSTGFGAVPFYIYPDVATFWIGISNAVAAGMMIAASYSLFAEGCSYNDPQDTSTIGPEIRTAFGTILGLGFILGTKSFLDQYEDLKIGVLGGTDARKALLIFFVMTLHSFSEGVGIGVSFGGLHGNELGVFISASLAVHNVPEGLAIAVALIGRGLSITTAAVWAIATSIPQPFMAVPAYIFVNTFIPILPVGLGFAGGAMAWVAFFELLTEAIEDTSIIATAFVAIPSCALMLVAQHALK